MGFRVSSSFLLTLALLSALATAKDGLFMCKSPATCQGLVGYVSPNDTTLAELQSLFTIKHLRSILGANNLPLSTLGSYRVRGNQTIVIPVPCLCTNGTGISNRIPRYTVKKDDNLYHIAADVYKGLVTSDHIAKVNNITNPNLIQPDWELWIPLPCSCDEVGGRKVAHYAHLVKEASTVEVIAAEFGTDTQTLLTLNGISGDSELIADQAFDVPLRACNSSIRSDSLDYPLLVANGTYGLTANNCVKCKCDAANNYILQCEPSQLQTSKMKTCPSMQCEGSDSLNLGNTTISTCSRSTCAYAGFSNQTIFTTRATESTCAAPPSAASRSGLSWWSFISIHLVLLCVIFVQ